MANVYSKKLRRDRMSLSKTHSATNFDTELKTQVIGSEGIVYTPHYDSIAHVPDIGYGFFLVPTFYVGMHTPIKTTNND